MKRLVLLLLLALFAAPVLRAQFEGAISMKVTTYYDVETSKVSYLMSVKNDMLAIATTGGPPEAQGGNFIIRGDKRLMWIVNDAAKNYVEFPLIDDTSAKKTSASKEKKDAAPILAKTGKNKVILGYACDEWVGASGDESSTIWASPKLGKVYDGLFTSLNQMSKGGEGGESAGDWQAELVRLKLFPLSITTRRDGTLYETQEVTSIEAKPMPAAAFEAPPGYEKQSMKNEFENMLKKMQEQMKQEEGAASDTGGR